MTEEKKDLAYYQAHPERYNITAAGSVQDRQEGNRFITSFPELNPNAITPATAREFIQKQKARRGQAVAIGRIRAARQFLIDEKLPLDGLSLADPADATEEEMLAAGAGVDALNSYYYELAYLKSAKKAASGDGGNFRALVEGYGKTFETFAEDPHTRAPETPPGQISGPPDAILKLLNGIERQQQTAIDRARAIDADPYTRLTIEKTQAEVDKE
jgi:hypothetical protein